jgi:hypothetical protein
MTKIERALQLEPTIPSESFTSDYIIQCFCPSAYGLKDNCKGGSGAGLKDCIKDWNLEWDGECGEIK